MGWLAPATMAATELGRALADLVLPQGRTLPRSGRQLTPEVLEDLTDSPRGSVRSVRILDEHHGTAGRVHLELGRGQGSDLPETLFAKLAPRNLLQKVLMTTFELGSREVLFYSRIAPDVPVRVPRCHAVEHDPGRGRNVILLEDLSATATFRDITSPVDAGEAESVVDALADLHATFWDSDRLAGDLAALRARSEPAEQLGNLFVSRILGNLKGRTAEVVPAEVQRASMTMVEHRDRVDAFWRSQEPTLCHGDTHLGNLFFEGRRPGFLDWQAVMIGPGIRDVSYFLVSSVDPDVLAGMERDLVERWVKRLAEGGVEVDPGETWDLYRASVSEIYISAVVTAGTSDRMQPAEISSVGVDRVVAAVQRLDTFELVEQIVRTGSLRQQP